MSRFGIRPVRNTTHTTWSFNFLYCRQLTTAEPRPGGFKARKDFLKELAKAPADQGNARFSIEATRAYVENCKIERDRRKDELKQQPCPPDAQVQGRDKSFLGTVRRNFLPCLGIGMGQVQVVKPAWSRPDRDTPAASCSNPAEKTSSIAGDNTTTTADPIEQRPTQPSGLDLCQVKGPLDVQLESLAEHLDQQAAHSDSQWRTNDLLEVVRSALAIATDGNQKLAADTLEKLRHCGWQDLVPQPGHWFDGSRAYIGKPRPTPQALEKLVINLVDLPCGVELLTRLTKKATDQPPHKPDPTSIQREALLVYHRAIRHADCRITPDTQSFLWLQKAAFAACKIVHEGPSVLLSVQHRAAFHGVRNGLLSIRSGGHWAQANSHLQSLSNKNKVNQPQSRSPFRARKAAANAATQVKLATPLRTSKYAANAAIQVGLETPRGLAEAEILKIRPQLELALDKALKQAECQKQGHSQGMDSHDALQKLLELTQSLIGHIEKNAKQHRDLAMISQVRWTWRSIDRQPKTTTPNSAALTLPKAAANDALQQESALTELKTKLTPKSTVLDIIPLIRESLKHIPVALTEPQVAPVQSEAPPKSQEKSQESTSTPKEVLDLTPALSLLEKIVSSHETLNNFIDPKKSWEPSQLPHWVMPAVSGKSAAVTMKFGHTRGINTSGLSTTIRQFTGILGFGLRLDAEASRTSEKVLKYAKQSRGLELFIGDSHQKHRLYGLAGGLRLSLLSLPSEDGVGAGFTVNWSQTRLNSTATGVFVRSPIYGEQTPEQLDKARNNFKEILKTVAGWREMTDDDTGESYKSALEAVLSRHPEASVSTIDQLRTDSVTNSSGLMASVSGGGPFSLNVIPRFFGSMSLGIGLGATRQTESTQYKMHAGAQSFAGTTESTKSTVNVQFRYVGHLGSQVSPLSGSSPTSLQARSSSGVAQFDLHRKQQQSTATVVRQPDGSMVGEKAQEFNTFEDFRAVVEQRWDEWVKHGIGRREWKTSEPEAIKKMVIEKDLIDFLEAAKLSLREAGTVTLNETLEIRPDVCAELSACLALEELARARGDDEQVKSAYERRELLLQAESSYRPYKLKAIVQSQREKSHGVNLVLNCQQKKSALATHEYDSFP